MCSLRAGSTLLGVRSPLADFRRFRGKINIQRPQKLHFDRQLLVDVCKPHYPSKRDLPPRETCGDLRPPNRQRIDNPFERILARECLERFNRSRMVGFYHANPFPLSQKNPVAVELKKNGMTVIRYGKDILSRALRDTPFQAVLQLFHSHGEIVFSERVQVDKLLDITRKARPLVLLAGVVDGRLLSRNQLAEYGEIGSADAARSGLCGVLDAGAPGLAATLLRHQLALVADLDTFVRTRGSAE